MAATSSASCSLSGGNNPGRRLANKVFANDIERDKAQLCVKHGQLRVFMVVIGTEPDLIVLDLKAQLKECSQQWPCAVKLAWNWDAVCMCLPTACWVTPYSPVPP